MSRGDYQAFMNEIAKLRAEVTELRARVVRLEPVVANTADMPPEPKRETLKLKQANA
jgi:hypothetical protein